MKYDKIESWLATLSGDEAAHKLAVWYDHVEKFNANYSYQPHSAEFVAMWNTWATEHAE